MQATPCGNLSSIKSLLKAITLITTLTHECENNAAESNPPAKMAAIATTPDRMATCSNILSYRYLSVKSCMGDVFAKRNLKWFYFYYL